MLDTAIESDNTIISYVPTPLSYIKSLPSNKHAPKNS